MHDDTPDPDAPSPDATGSPNRYDDAAQGRPPRQGRFRPGHSGNPNGRPKGMLNVATLLTAELQRPVTLTEGGRTRRVPKAAAMVASQVNKALKGDTRAFNTVLQATRPRGEAGPGGAGPDGAGPDDPGAVEAAAARELLFDRLDHLARRHAEERDRLAAEMAAASVPEEHVELLFGPRGDRLRERLTVALGAIQARGFDIRQAAELSVFAEVAGECAGTLLGDGKDG